MPKLRRCLSIGKVGEESDSTHQGMGKWENEVNGMNGLRGKVSHCTHTTIVMEGKQNNLNPTPPFIVFLMLLGFWALPRVSSPISLIFSSFHVF